MCIYVHYNSPTTAYRLIEEFAASQMTDNICSIFKCIIVTEDTWIGGTNGHMHVAHPKINYII